MKLAPVTVRVSAGPPEVAEVGEIALSVGAGLELPPEPPLLELLPQLAKANRMNTTDTTRRSAARRVGM